MIAVRTFPDELSMSHILRPMRLGMVGSGIAKVKLDVVQ